MSRIINIVLISLGVFGLAFTWTYYYVRVLWIGYVVAAGLTIVCGIVLYWISRANKTRKEKKITDKRKVAALKLKLIMDSDSAEIFEESFRKNGYETDTVNSHSFVASKNDRHFVHINFSFKKLTDQDIVAPLKLAVHYDCPKLFVFCADFDASAKELSKMVKKEICLADINETYRFLKKHGTLPEIDSEDTIKKSPSKILYFALNKKRFPFYFWNAVFLVLLSQITFFPIYNLVIASLMLGLAVYSRFNKRFNLETDSLSI